MKAYWILTAIGPDRPGLVDQIAEFLADRGINIESSRMAVLGGEFAFMVLISGESAVLESLPQDLPRLADITSLSLAARAARAPSERPKVAAIPYRITATSMDHPGIVHRIGQVLHKFNINIESMDTSVAPAPVSGTPVFSLDCRISVPTEVRIADLKETLVRLSEEMNIDVEFEPVSL